MGNVNYDQIQFNAKLPVWFLAGEPAIIIEMVMPYVFGAAGIILLIMIITSGYQIMASKGDPKAIQIAQGKITSSLTGLVLLFTAFWIVRIIGSFLGLSIFEEVFN